MRSRVITDERDFRSRLRRAAREHKRDPGGADIDLNDIVETTYHGHRVRENRPETDSERAERAMQAAAETALVRRWGVPKL